MTLVTLTSVDYVENPHDWALRASACLSADKGIPNEIEELPGHDGYDVVTDNGMRFRFLQRTKPEGADFAQEARQLPSDPYLVRRCPRQ